MEKTPLGKNIGKVDMTRGYMIEDIGYSIILLSRVMGFAAARYLNIFMVYFIKTIKMTMMPLNWASTLSENLCEQLEAVKNKRKFYMTSYLVYLLATREMDYLGSYKRGSVEDPNA